MEGVRIPVDGAVVADFCRRWRVREFALFGSVLGEDFRPESDVDVLVTFEPGREWTLEEYLAMVRELNGLLGREVDLVVRSSLRNPFSRYHILKTRKVVHAT